MLSAEIFVLEPFRLLLGGGERIPEAWGDASYAGRARPRDLRDLLEFLLEFTREDGRVRAQLVQQALRQPFALAHQGQRQVLDIELLVARLFGQLLGFSKGFLRLDGQSVKPDHELSFPGRRSSRRLLIKR